MVDDIDTLPPPGRPVVLEPAPPGLWMMLLGVSVAALAPLFGFLVGSIGVLVAVLGGRRMYRANRAKGIDGSEPKD